MSNYPAIHLHLVEGGDFLLWFVKNGFIQGWSSMDELFGKRSKRQMQHVDRQENKRILTKSDRYGECSQAVFSFSRLFLEGGS